MSLFQVTNALAVAEEAFMFEHRDLHWGNVLISKCKTKETQFIIHDRKNIVKLHGVKVREAIFFPHPLCSKIVNF